MVSILSIKMYIPFLISSVNNKYNLVLLKHIEAANISRRDKKRDSSCSCITFWTSDLKNVGFHYLATAATVTTLNKCTLPDYLLQDFFCVPLCGLFWLAVFQMVSWLKKSGLIINSRMFMCNIFHFIFFFHATDTDYITLPWF